MSSAGFNLFYIIFCCPKCKCSKNSYRNQEYKIYKAGKERMAEEMDIRIVLEATRTAQALSKVMLDEDQRGLIKFRKDMLLKPSLDWFNNK